MRALSVCAGASRPTTLRRHVEVTERASKAIYSALPALDARPRHLVVPRSGIIPPVESRAQIAVAVPPVTTVFQPIVDLMTGVAIGYEALSRACGPESLSPSEMFARARALGELWELERACRASAIERVAELRLPPSCLLFLNVSPNVIEDPRFVEGFTLAALRRHGVEPARVVIEVTEDHHIADHERFQRVVTHYTRQGFQFATDDFGSGHSSLLSLVACAPAFIKLDMEIVRNVDQSAYKRHIVRSLTGFAASVDARLVAEGVETWEELEALLRLGVRYGQGFLLARPAAVPPVLAEPTLERLRTTLRSAHIGVGDPEESIDALLTTPMVVEAATMTAEQLEDAFRRTAGLEHLVVVRQGRPIGLITREDLLGKLAGRYAYALHQRKHADGVMKTEVLCVSVGTPITTLASRAMERRHADIYDPVLVVDADGSLAGTVTMKTLIKRSVELEVRSAQNANPLTGLPGNRAIHKWIHAASATPTLTIVYADLDRFKEYNDRYGFLMGDELIRLAARILTRTLLGDASTGRLGHVGGDDFVGVFPDGLDPSVLERVCAAFDEHKLELFDPEDQRSGYIEAKTRAGVIEQVPIVTMSLAIVERSRVNGDVHPGLLGQIAAALKRRVKQQTAEQRRSGFMADRRMHSSRPPPAA